MMITPLDYLKAFNNREHNVVRYYSTQGDEVLLVSKTFNRRTSTGELMADLLRHRVTKTCRDGAQIWQVDPMFNIYGGLARRHLGAESYGSAESTEITSRWVAALKRGLVAVLKPFAILREVPAVVGMSWTAWQKSHEVDVAMGFGPWGAVSAWLLRRLGRARIFVYIDRDYEAGLVDGPRARLTHWLERVLPARADLLVSIGPRLRTLRRETTGVEPLLCPTGVDYDRFAQHGSNMDEDDRVEIVYVGNVVEWSGVDLALDALALAPIDKLVLTVIGTGQDSYLKQLIEKAEALGISNRVTFAGPLPHADVPGRLLSAQVGLAMSLPNQYRVYAYPLKVLEYMAAGLGVLATEDTEAADIVSLADAGIAVPFDATALARTFERLASNLQLRKRFSENGRRAAQAMSWEASLGRERRAVIACLEGR